MLQFKKNQFESKERNSQSMGMNSLQYDMWKELVRMDAIQLPKHVNHWNANNLRTF